MSQLLNRFAWMLSLVLWFIVALVFIGIDSWTLRSDDIFFTAIWGAILSLFIKRFLLGEDFIDRRLHYFKDILLEEAKNQSEDVITITPAEKNLLVDVAGKQYTETNQTQLKVADNLITSEHTEINSVDAKINNDENLDAKYISEENFDDNYEDKIENKNIYSIASEEPKIEKVEEVPTAFDMYLKKITVYIKDFFATNTLAKMWSILVFLGLMFLLKDKIGWIWEDLGPVFKLCLWFIVSIVAFIAGLVLHGRWTKNEWLILIGLSILINYGVILSWRYLLWWDDWFLTEGVTFLLLIFNTVFWVVTSLVYQSRTLLIFSFVFAFVNPFIIWADSSGTPYTLVWYSLIISLGWLFLSQNSSAKGLAQQEVNSINYNILLFTTFILGNILILVAPFTTDIDWIIKMLASVWLSAWCIYTFWNIKSTPDKQRESWIVTFFVAAYTFVFFILLSAVSWKDILSSWFSYVIYITVIAWFFWATSFLFKKDSSNPILQFLLFVPLLLFLWIILTWQAFSTVWLLVIFLCLYLVSFGFLQSYFTTMLSYCYFVLMWLFVFVTDITIINSSSAYDISTFITVIFISFVFLFSTYYFSFKKNLTHLYSIGTILSIFLLVPVLVVSVTKGSLTNWLPTTTSLHVTLSILSIVIFALANWIFPFFNKNLLNNPKNIWNLITWSLAWVLFIAYELFLYGSVYFEWVAQWIWFVLLAVIYFAQSFLVVQMIGKTQIESWSDTSKTKASLKNVFYTYAWISLSLFSLAITFIFSKYPEIISTVWLFEATILYYFYSKSQDWKILTAWNALFVIWILKLWLLIDIVERGDFWFLVSFTIIAASLLLNIWFIDKSKNEIWKNIHYIFHIIWIAILWLLLSKIIISSWHWWSSFGIAIFIGSIGTIYSRLKNNFLKWFFIALLVLFSIIHIAWIQRIFSNLNYDNVNYLKILQYIVTWIIISNYFIWNKQINRAFHKIILAIIWFYTFVISNLFILDLFSGIFGHFSLTIYWWVIASILLFYWIAKDIIKLRTIGLYFIILTSAKIFFFDVWQLDNTTSRVVALMWLWILFIVVSTFYTNKYWNNILNELSPENLKNSNSDDDDDDDNDDESQEEIEAETEIENKTERETEVDSKNEADKAINTDKKHKETTRSNNIDNSKDNTIQEINSTSKISPIKEEYNNNDTIKTKKEKKAKKPKKDTNNKSDINNELHSDIEDTNEFMKKLTKVDVDNIKVVRFFPEWWDNFTIRAKNLMRLTKLIIKQTWKTHYKPWELEWIYNYVISNYKTKLSRREFDKLRTTIKDFIDNGWDVEIIKK